jgi:Flp pilus assembly protein TadG
MIRNRLRKLARSEEGFSLVFVATGFLAFLSVSMLAIDLGMLMTSRNQAQNSADASALAGATALVFDSWSDRSATGPAVQNALATARINQVMGGVVSIAPRDVLFPLDPNGIADRVQSTVYRDSAHGNPMPTIIAKYFGMATVSISATATAEAASANAETCLLPFTIPDKWTEKSDGKGVADGPWSPASTYDIYYSKGSNQNGGAALPNPDVYVPPGQTGYTGYNPATDVGMEITLKNNNQNKVSPSVYNPYDPPGSSGGSDYRNNIDTCNKTVLKMYDWLTPETGNMVGPTSQGVADLIAQDPNATWDTSCNCVKNSKFPAGQSPRIGRVPLYDPDVYAKGQQSGKSGPQLQVTNFLGFFIEQVDGAGDVLGRITPIDGLYDANAGPATGAFPVYIRLVK